MPIPASPRRKPGRPTHPITPREIIAIARPVFAENGYAGTSLSQIANLANLRKPSLYHHFETKEALYLVVVGDVVERLREMILAAGLDADDSFVDRLDRLGALIVDYFGANVDAAKLIVREMVGHGIYMTGTGRAEVEQTLRATAAFLEAGMKAGAFRKQNPRQLALSIVGLHVFYFAAADVSSSLVGRSVFTPPKLRERKISLLDQVRALCLA